MELSMLSISIPSKTFLLGEYGVLWERPALLLGTTPCFQVTALPRTAEAPQENPFHPESPAGILYHRLDVVLKDWIIQFEDPHHGLGGLGASSAQFLGLYAILHWIYQKKCNTFSPDFLLKDMLPTYQSLFQSAPYRMPSGADVIAQATGQLTYFDRTEKTIVSSEWPFDDLSFLLIRTPYKIKTHEHLEKLLPIPKALLNNFGRLVMEAKLALQQKEAIVFASIVTEYAEALKKINLSSEDVDILCTYFMGRPGVHAAKGCGALGADVILVLVEREHKPGMLEVIHGLNLTLISDETGLAAYAETETALACSAV